MTRRERTGLLVGAVVMAAATLLPWATARSWRFGAVAVSGFGHGAGYVLALAAASALLVGLRRDALGALTGVVSVGLATLHAVERVLLSASAAYGARRS